MNSDRLTAQDGLRNTEQYRAALAFFRYLLPAMQTDKRTNRPKIWIYRDKDTGEPKGDATGTQQCRTSHKENKATSCVAGWLARCWPAVCRPLQQAAGFVSCLRQVSLSWGALLVVDWLQ